MYGLQKVAVFDQTCADVNGEMRYHWRLNQHDLYWKSDFELVVTGMGFDRIRTGIPWPLVERSADEYDWSLPDAMFGHAEDLGCQLIWSLTQFGIPLWLPGEHPALSPELPDRFARYTEAFLRRYAGRLSEVVPLVEIRTEARHRAEVGIWGPHNKNDRGMRERIEDIRVECFNRSAAVCKSFGVRVISHEPYDGLDIALRLHADEIGIDHYTFTKIPFEDLVREWHAAFVEQGIPNPVFSLMERGSHEWFDLDRGQDFDVCSYTVCTNRIKDVRYYGRAIRALSDDGIQFAKVTAFGIGNFWSDLTLTPDPNRECDRNGLATLVRDERKNLRRLVHYDLVEAFHATFSSTGVVAS